MKFNELKSIIKRLLKEYVKKRINRIYIALALSIIVAGSTAATAWLLDPAVKKIFIDQDPTFSWLIPILIIIAFSTKGISLYIARINIIHVGQNISGEYRNKVLKTFLLQIFKL